MTDFDIEETNRLRAEMGMPLLPVPGQSQPKTQDSNGLNFKSSDSGNEEDEDDQPGSTLESREALAGDNWMKLQALEEQKRKSDARRLEIQKARDAAAKNRKLEGKGLGDDDGKELSARDWLLSAKKREKKVEKQRQRQLHADLEERERLAALQYTEKDLAGLKVGHELGAFDDGGEQILTLKDANVEGEDGDELENVDVRDREKLKERIAAKKQRLDYDPNADDDELERGVLSKYDEEIFGKKGQLFTLDGKGSTAEQKAAALAGASAPKRLKINLDDLATNVQPLKSDYIDVSEIKIKKPKKKKDKSKSRKRNDDDNDEGFLLPTSRPSDSSTPLSAGLIEDDQQQDAKPKRKADMSFADDDEDLQQQLAASRRKALKKRRTPADLVRELREEETNAMDTNGEDDHGLIIDETSEFLANLKRPEDNDEDSRPRRPKAEPSPQPTNHAPLPPNIKYEDDEGANNQDAEMAEAYNEVEPKAEDDDNEEEDTGLGAEGTVGESMADALKLLRERGLVKDANGDDANMSYRERMRFLAEKEARETAADARAKAQREADRARGRFKNMSNKERELAQQQANRQREFAEARVAADRFNQQYRPNVDIRYTDEHGRNLNVKEAWKDLSHKFHGKESGKLKMEKHLKKIEDEKSREAQSLFDPSKDAGMSNAQGAMGRKNRQAGVRLQ